MFKKLFTVAVLSLGLLITGCSREAQVASNNLSHAADNFQLEC